MDSIKNSSRSFLILWILMFMLTASATSDLGNVFRQYFAMIGKFQSTFSLSLLNVTQRENICSELGAEGKHYISTDIISLVHVLVSDTNRNSSMYPIPAFLCITDNGKETFYATYTTDDQYFKLINSPHLSEEQRSEIMTVLSSSRNISSYADLLQGIRTKILQYFKSVDYRKKAGKVLKPYYQNETWKNVCSKYCPGYKVPEGFEYRSSNVPFTSILIDVLTEVHVPVIYCPMHEGLSFHVLHFVDGIFVQAQWSVLYQDQLTSQHYDNVKESLKTVLPTLYRTFRKDLANYIGKKSLGYGSE